VPSHVEEDSIALRENKKEMVPTQRIMKSLLEKKKRKKVGKKCKLQEMSATGTETGTATATGREENKRERERGRWAKEKDDKEGL